LSFVTPPNHNYDEVITQPRDVQPRNCLRWYFRTESRAIRFAMRKLFARNYFIRLDTQSRGIRQERYRLGARRSTYDGQSTARSLRPGYLRATMCKTAFQPPQFRNCASDRGTDQNSSPNQSTGWHVQPFQREHRVSDVRIVAHPSEEEATATVPPAPRTRGEGVKSRATRTLSGAWRSILEDVCMP
jgi:hypothetical protein